MIDAHTHLGLDEDGRSLTLEQLLSQLDAAEARRACVFPLHDPERQPSYRVPNDRVLGWAGESDGRLVPFCAARPSRRPRWRGRTLFGRRRTRDQAAPTRAGVRVRRRGDGRVSSRSPKSACVPILIHAGRGLPPLADGLADLALRHPGAALILAHGAICDQGILTTRLAEHPGVLYDISCFFPLDVVELFSRVPAERIVFASDPPYGMPATTLYLALRIARQAGLDEQATKAMLGGTMAALIDGRRAARDRPPAARRPRSPSPVDSPAYTATQASSARPCSPASSSSARAMLDMAIAACRDPEPGCDGEALETIGAALAAADRLLGDPRGWRAGIDRPRLPGDRARRDRDPRRVAAV